jgi:hypothetical protein
MSAKVANLVFVLIANVEYEYVISGILALFQLFWCHAFDVISYRFPGTSDAVSASAKLTSPRMMRRAGGAALRPCSTAPSALSPPIPRRARFWA